MKVARHVLLLAAALASAPAFAQTAPGGSKPALATAVDDLNTLREQLKGDKKRVVASNMELTDAEAKGFWPLYEQYQAALNKINDRLAMAVAAYAKEYRANTLTDAKAAWLVDQTIAIDQDEARLNKTFVPRLARVLPGRKLARYLQIENKLRAIVKIEIASEVPLVQ